MSQDLKNVAREEIARGKVVEIERGEVAKGQIAQGITGHDEDLAVD